MFIALITKSSGVHLNMCSIRNELATFLKEIYHQDEVCSIVGEPKSRIVQKHTFFAPERYTAGILYTDSLNSA